MRKRNWREYNKKLVQRGSLTFLIDPKVVKTLEVKTQKRKKGRPLEFSDQLILMLLMIKIHYKMPYRMLEGFAGFFFEQFRKIKVPTYSLMCKRAKGLSKKLPKLSSCRPKTIIVDATGIKVQGEGEWKVKIHGKGRPRKWIKLHVAIDERTQEIVGEISTEATVDDGKAFPKVVQQVRGRPKLVIGDGAYDDRDVRDLIRKKGGKCLIPPPSNAVYHGTDLERDDAIKVIRAFGGDKVAKSIWGKLSGYSRRALVETTFSRYKKMFGKRTNYGEKVFVKLNPHHHMVLSVPVGLYIEDENFPQKKEELIGFDRIMATLPSLVSYRHEGALVPVELANGVASLSNYPSAAVLKIFAEIN